MKTRIAASRQRHSLFLRFVSLLLVPTQLATLVPLEAFAAAAPSAKRDSPAPSLPLVRTPTDVKVNRTLPAFTPAERIAALPADPTDEALGRLRLFPHRLMPIATDGSSSRLSGVRKLFSSQPAATATNDNRALAAALQQLQNVADPHHVAALVAFVKQHPQSRWSPSLRHELARRWFNQGYFTRAIGEWESVWNQVKDGRDAGSLAVGDEVLAHLLEAGMGLSDTKRLTALIGAAEARPISNLLEAKLGRAKQSVWLLKHKGGQNVMCGPLALQGILRHEGRPFAPLRLDTVTDDYIATGLPLAELRAYGEHYQLDLVMARRPAHADIPVPCVLHSTGGHYSALVERDGDDYFLVDRAMQFEGWVPRAAIDEQASGYFLLRRDNLPASWEKVSEAEGKSVFGRDGLHGQEPNGPNSTDCGQGAGGNGGGCCGMPTYSFNAKLAAVRIEDTPVGYAPPVGPSVYFRVAYKDLDDSKPATAPNFSNVGRVWAMDWVAWVDHVAGTLTASSRATVHVQGGGTEISTYKTAAGKFGPNDRSFTTVTRSGAATYTREMPDGSKEIYNTPDNPTAPNRVFLTQKLDPAGNALTYTYDAGLRLVAVTDAIGQVTTLEHNFAADPMKVTKVTDPFGRSAVLGYNAQGQLDRITDMIGMTSTFTYDAAEFITGMTTPYGTTTFTKVQGSPAYNRTVTATDPLGQQERLQFIEPIDLPTTAPAVPPSVNVGGVNVPFRAETARLGWRNSFYWSKQAMQQAPGDVRAARNYRWFTDANWLVTGVLESVKEPLEDPVWFNYPNQVVGSLPNYAGQGARPEKTLRILPDGTPQLAQTYYNALGRLTNSIDPSGRSTLFIYASNQVDLLEVRQKTGSNSYDRLLQFSYNAAHLPLTATDAARQAMQYTFNARGQLSIATNPRGEARTFQYDANGYLTSVDGPLPGTADSVTFTYDSFGRVRTLTDPDGYRIMYDFDALDRPTVVTYPDGTFEQYSYHRLDRVSERDRLGRVTTYAYDALRRPTEMRDSLDRVTRYEWCQCGSVAGLVDPLNRRTTWRYDVQSRVTSKEYADGSKIQYVYENNTSRLRRIVDERGQFTEMEYAVDNAVRRISYPNAQVPTPTVSFEYDSIYPRWRSMTDGGGTTTYAYHPVPGVSSLGASHLATIDGPLPNDTVTYDYDELGRVQQRTINGVASTAAYDTRGRVAGVSNILGNFVYTYDGSSARPATMTSPNGLVAASTYFNNSGDRQLQLLAATRAGSPVSRFTYGYNAVDNVTSWSRQTGSDTPTIYTFAYDAAHQLTNAVLQQAGTTLRSAGYAFDAAANRLAERMDASTRSFAYNALNEIAASSQGPAADANYEWDGANRLAAIVRGAQRTEFSYDALDRRTRIVEKQNDVVTQDRHYVWCGASLCEERDASGAGVVKRFFDQGEQHATGPEAGSYYYTRDHLGSVRDVLDGAGVVRARYDYDPWGRRTRISGSLDAAFGFAGYFHHRPSGLSLALFRVYDAELGRWLSRDPIGENGGINLYAYAANSPISFGDPFGENPMLIGGLIGGIGGALVGGGWSVASDLWNGRSVDWGAAGRSAVKGGIVGAVSGATFGLVAPAAGGAAMTAVNAGASRLLPNAVGALVGAGSAALGDAAGQGAAIGLGWQDCFSWGELGMSAALGGLFGGIGREWSAGNGRVAPFGNRAGNPNGTLPHYHRGRPNPASPGNNLPGQGIGRHRPWDSKPQDTSFWDRF